MSESRARRKPERAQAESLKEDAIRSGETQLAEDFAESIEKSDRRDRKDKGKQRSIAEQMWEFYNVRHIIREPKK